MSFKNSEIVQDSVLRSVIFILENTSNINVLKLNGKPR